MENGKTIVKQVTKIWRLYKSQQLMLKTAMGLEIPYRLRNLLSRDFMICSLLKKEMANLYDALKCCLMDACITTRPEMSAGHYALAEEHNLDSVLSKIERLHEQITNEYAVLLELVKDSNINIRMIHQHQKQMDRMAHELYESSAAMDGRQMQT